MFLVFEHGKLLLTELTVLGGSFDNLKALMVF